MSQSEIYELLQDVNHSMTYIEIAKRLNKSKVSISVNLRKMIVYGLVEYDHILYRCNKHVGKRLTRLYYRRRDKNGRQRL